MNLYDQLPPGWNEQPSMPGTASPQQMAQMNQQQMLADALRAGVPQQQSVNQAGRVTAASGGLNEGLNSQAIGGALKQGIGSFGDWLNTPGDLGGTEFI